MSLLLQGLDPIHQLPQQQPKQFDICIANILQGPLLDLQPRLSGYVKPGGQLLLSGILTSQVTVLQFLQAGDMQVVICMTIQVTGDEVTMVMQYIACGACMLLT